MLTSHIMCILILIVAIVGLLGCVLAGATRQDKRGFFTLALTLAMIVAGYLFVLAG